MTSPHRLRLVGAGRRRGYHYRRHAVAPYRTPWGLIGALAWMFGIGWLLGSWLPGIPVAVFLLAAALTVAGIVQERRRR